MTVHDSDPKCGAELIRDGADHDGPHVCDAPPGHPHMRNHGCACGYAWPVVGLHDAPSRPMASPTDDPEFLKREIGRIKTHFHRRCETLTARAHRAEDLLGELIDWFGAPDWTGPSLPVDLGRRIADVMEPLAQRPSGEEKADAP